MDSPPGPYPTTIDGPPPPRPYMRTRSLIFLRDERPMAVDRLIVLRDEQPMAVDLKQLRCHEKSPKMPIHSQCLENYYHAKPSRFKFIVSDIEEGEATKDPCLSQILYV